MSEGLDIQAFREALLSWYEEAQRDLPWRREPSPYGTFLSEMMLQQTRVDTVIPYYKRFLEAFPDFRALGEAEEEAVLKAWEGLGYYSRARNLRKAAKLVMNLYEGVLPSDPELLGKLPGVGAYSKGSIASIAFGIPVPAVDGNVLRVLARVSGNPGDLGEAGVKKALRALAAELVSPERPGDFNQGLMEIGALVCLPNGAPLCGACPLFPFCVAGRKELTGKIPPPKEKKALQEVPLTVLRIWQGEALLLRKRPTGGLLGGLYELPNLEGQLNEGAVEEALRAWGFAGFTLIPLGRASHVFTHLRWQMVGYEVRDAQGALPPGWVLADREELAGLYAVPRAFRAFLPGEVR